MDRDEHPRADTTLEKLAGLRADHGRERPRGDGDRGQCQRPERRRRRVHRHPSPSAPPSWVSRPLRPPGHLGGGRSGAGDDGHRPGARHRRALERAGLTLAEMDLIELNEAFAAQVLAVLREWRLPDGLDRVNVQRLGHLAGPPGRRHRRAHPHHAAARAATAASVSATAWRRCASAAVRGWRLCSSASRCREAFEVDPRARARAHAQGPRFRPPPSAFFGGCFPAFLLLVAGGFFGFFLRELFVRRFFFGRFAGGSLFLRALLGRARVFLRAVPAVALGGGRVFLGGARVLLCRRGRRRRSSGPASGFLFWFSVRLLRFLRRASPAPWRRPPPAGLPLRAILRSSSLPRLRPPFPSHLPRSSHHSPRWRPHRR